MKRYELANAYTTRYESVLVNTAEALDAYLRDMLKGMPRIDRVAVRAKGVDRFVAKAQKKLADGTMKYEDPLSQIQDQIGARIVTYYLNDVEAVSRIVEEYLPRIERKTVVPDAVTKFGYKGKHYILFIPSEAKQQATIGDCPTFFELQIKTLFQHAWGEAEHDIGYKGSLHDEQKRLIAYAAAQAWGADRIFNELADKLTSEADDVTPKDESD